MGLVFALSHYISLISLCVLSIMQNLRQGCCIIKCSHLLYIHHIPHSAPFSLDCCLYPTPQATCRGGSEAKVMEMPLAKSMNTHVGLQITGNPGTELSYASVAYEARPTKWFFFFTSGGRRNKIFHVGCFCINLSFISVKPSSPSLFNCMGQPLHSAGGCPLSVPLWDHHSHFYSSRLLGEAFFSPLLHSTSTSSFLKSCWCSGDFQPKQKCQNFKQGLLRVVSFFIIAH